jgi:hypothetical protein
VRVLIACEFSGIVREAFRKRGHDAWSCDLLPTEIPGQHIQGDVLPILGDGWDLMIAHPPCTYLSYAGMSKWNEPGRETLREDALRFFIALYNAPIPKRICLWLRGLPALMRGCLAYPQPSGFCIKSNGQRYNYYYHQGKTAHERSRFFPCIADAMAEQWGAL